MKELTADQLFEIKQKFLQEIPHPKLIQKQLDKLTFYQSTTSSNSSLKEAEDMELTPFLAWYIQELMDVKLQISNASDGLKLYEAIDQLLQIHNLLIKKLYNYFPENTSAKDEQIKQSDAIDAYIIWKELQSSKVTENEIKDYLCSQFEQETESYSEFTKAVLRARKIVVS